MKYERKDDGFFALGGYFDGSNSRGLRFIQTQPVVTTYLPNVGAKALPQVSLQALVMGDC
jgi:hypothetical protein